MDKLINFSCYKIGDAGVKTLAASIGANLPQLRELDLNFKGLFYYKLRFSKTLLVVRLLQIMVFMKCLLSFQQINLI